MSQLIRIASGAVSAYDLLNDENSLVINWTRYDDMPTAVYWSASQPEFGVQAEFVAGLGKGTGGFYGGYSCVLQFFLMTAQMRDYVENTLLNGNGIGRVTAYLHNPRFTDNDGFAVYQGELVSPFAANAESTYTRYGEKLYSNNQYLFRRGTLVSLEILGTISGLALGTLAGEYIAPLE